MTKLLLSLLYRKLDVLSRTGDRSQELLCYGYQVMARKRSS
jgi:hypothetical protein